MSDSAHRRVPGSSHDVNDLLAPDGAPSKPTPDELGSPVFPPGLAGPLEAAQRADSALAVRLHELDAGWSIPKHGLHGVSDDDARGLGRRSDIAVLREQFTVANEYVRGCDKAERWLSNRIDLAVALQTVPDISAMLQQVKDAVHRVSEPVPSLELIREDLAVVTDFLEPQWSESQQACARLWSECWNVLDESIRLAKGERELTGALVAWLRASVAYFHVAYTPARVLRDYYRAEIDEAGRDVASTSPGPTHTGTGLGEREASGDGTCQDTQTRFRFERDGAVWRIQFEGESGSISDNDFTALKYIAHLLARPHEAVCADQLSTVAEPPPNTAKPEYTFNTAGAAAVSCKERRLTEEIEEAVASGAFAKVEELGAELQRLKDSHNKNKTRRGKARRLSQTPLDKAAERVRKAITVVKAELRSRNLPKLAAHLDRIVKETISFTYRPEKPEPPWRISP